MSEIIEKIHSDLVVVDPVKLADMSVADLMALAKETNSRATKAAKQTLVHVGQTGVVLIELKNRLPHGTFMLEVKCRTDIDHRTASNYMLIARHFGNVSNLRGVRDALRYIHDAATTAKRGGNPPPPAAPASRPADIEVEAEIVERPATATAPPQDDVETTVETTVEIEPQEPPAPPVAPPTPSPAPSLIETSEAAFAEILGLLPRLRPVELKELVTVINTRWLNHPAPAPVDHLAACWKSANPEQRAAFLETCHLIEAP